MTGLRLSLRAGHVLRPVRLLPVCVVVGLAVAVAVAAARQTTSETRDPSQLQDQQFAKLYAEWTGEARYGSPLVDHLPLAKGIPTPKDVLGYHVGAPQKLTYYADILKYYRALAAATPRVRVETIGRSDEGRELVVVWVSSEQNLNALDQNRSRLARLADPRGLTAQQIDTLIATTKPHYHVIGGLHSSETGAPEMLMELVYRLAVESSPFVTEIRDNVYVSVTPVADADGRDRVVDWFYLGLEAAQKDSPAAPARASAGGAAGRRGGRGAMPADGQRGGQPAGERTEAGSSARGGQAGGIGNLPYWGKYVYHDNNRDINVALVQMRALTDWYYTAHPPIMHDLHESMALMYTYSGGPPQNPNLDPLLFAELPWFANWELAQMTKWGMPGVYTHAFMDGWSPGYLASVAYNHNGVMRMYETQSGRDAPSPGASATQVAPSPAASAAPAPAAPTAQASPARAPAAASDVSAPAAPAGAKPASATSAAPAVTPAAPPAPGGGRASAVPTGRGGTQEREWYRGLPVPPNAAATFSRRANANYMQTGVLSALQLTAQFPRAVVENFYIKTRNSIEEGKTTPPFGYVIPVQRDMTKAAELVRILRLQGIEVGQIGSQAKVGDLILPAGSYVIKRDQPYGRLVKNLLEKQVYPDSRLTTYDDSGWTMGLAMHVEVKEVGDPAVLKLETKPVTRVTHTGRIAGRGTAALAVAHYGSNNMISFRFRLAAVPMRIAERGFTAEGTEFPPGSFVVSGLPSAEARAAVEQLGLTAAALSALPAVSMHDAPPPRIAIYSQWTSTQDLGWYRLTFDNFGVPYDLIYKEQVRKGQLRKQYDVILMAAQTINRQVALQAPASRPQPYQKSDKYRFLGAYGETPDMSGGLGQEGVDAFAQFLEEGGTLVAAGAAVRFPIEFGWARSVDVESLSGVTAQRPIIQAEIGRPDHPVFFGYAEKTLPVKYVGGSVLRVGVADQAQILARYVGGDGAVLSGLLVGADQLRQRVFAVDLPRAHNGKGRVILFANNPIYRWQNHGEFNLVFNALLNWAFVPASQP